MIAVRICKRLEERIPFLPELDPLVGKMVEMIVLEESEEDAQEESASDPYLSDEAPQREPVREKEFVKKTSKYSSKHISPPPPPPPAAARPEPPRPVAPPPPPPRPPEPVPFQRQRVRICGMVDGITDGGDSFRLVVDAKHSVPCAWASEGPSPAIGAGGWKIIIVGTGIFDASGTLLRVDVKAGAGATQADLRFARVPTFGETDPDEAPANAKANQDLLAPDMGTVAHAKAPPEEPRPAFSASTSFRQIFGASKTAEKVEKVL
jgi:hypothetical protein